MANDSPGRRSSSVEQLTLQGMRVLECVDPHYRNCLATLFFTGLRFGEMAAQN